MKTILRINLLLLSIILIAIITLDYNTTIFLILDIIAGLLLFISLIITVPSIINTNKRIKDTKEYILSKYPKASDFKFDDDNPNNKGIWYRLPNAKVANFETLH